MNCITYSSSNSFSTINSISMSVNSSYFTSVFFKTAYHAYPGVQKILQDLIDKFLNTFF